MGVSWPEAGFCMRGTRLIDDVILRPRSTSGAFVSTRWGTVIVRTGEVRVQVAMPGPVTVRMDTPQPLRL